jgi:hypothetical protein
VRRFASFILVLCIALVFLITPMQAAQAPPEGSAGPQIGDSSVLPEAWPEDAQSTTGPVPPEGIDRGEQGDLAPEVQVVLSGVPAYLWYNGCGPTAAGMVIGYWDGNGFPDLVPGDAGTQTAAVNNMMSSSGNYDDYCLPLDYPSGPLLDDKSMPPFGDEHPDDCVADLMKTSQSYYGNYWGWSWYSDVEMALQGYVSMVAPHYTATVVNQLWGTFTWNSFRAEIDAGRPVVFLVDTDGDGGTDHFVTAYGYRDDGGTNQYACRDTWDTGIHWYNFAQMASGRLWGIYGATTFRLNGSSGGEYKVHLPLAGKTLVRGFDSDFDGTAQGWEAHSGSWWIDSDDWLTTLGVSSAWASASYVATYKNFDYEARLWRTGCGGCSHGIMVRGTPYPLGSGYRWNSGYGFYINRNGTYAIFKYASGSYTGLKSWTSTSAINTGSAWNLLRVVASDSNLYFYINGTLVWAGSDSSLAWGRVGIAMARDTSSGNQLWADWAELTPLSTTFLTAQISPEQQALNEAAEDAGGTALDSMGPANETGGTPLESIGPGN